MTEIQNPMIRVAQMLQPWQVSLEDSSRAQEAVLQRYLSIYAQTEYGAAHGAEDIGTVEDYREKFPVATYDDYKPFINCVMAGENDLLLNEPVLGWAITRGTTKGENKFIPIRSEIM